MKRCQILTIIAAVGLALLAGSVSAKTTKAKRHKLAIQSGSQTIPEIVESFGLRKGRASIQIVSMPERKILYQLNPDLALNPASNAKLVTAAAALKELGPDFTFKTEFYSTALLRQNGSLPNLWIKGYGDPVFVTEELDSIRGRFRAAGLRRIEGPIAVDDTYFDRYPLATYMSDVNEKIYNIVTGPLSFNFNSIMIKARPGARLGDQPILETEPPTRFVKFKNLAKTGGRGNHIDAENNDNDARTVTIRGSIPKTIREFSFRHGILDPAIYTGTVVMEALEEDGVTIRGPVNREAVPSQSLLILAHSSPPLREILKSLGKFSNNFSSEQLLKTLGAVRFGPPGSTSSGLRVLKNYLTSLGIREGTYVLDNGSGLSKLTRLSASQLVHVLMDIDQRPWRDDLIDSLSVAGEDGTLRRRMRGSPLKGRVLAKTGTLNGVTALSGYVMDSAQKQTQLVFSFIFNDTGLSPQKVERLEDSLLQAALRLQ